MYNMEQFLIELKELSLKHNIFIGGCGCCGSPFLFQVNDNSTPDLADRLEWNYLECVYTVEREEK